MGRSTKVSCGCGSEMDVQTSEVVWVEQVTPGGSPYKLWNADKLQCKRCKCTALLLASRPYMQEWEESFYIELERIRENGMAVELKKEADVNPKTVVCKSCGEEHPVLYSDSTYNIAYYRCGSKTFFDDFHGRRLK